MSNHRNVELNYFKSRLRHINNLISYGKLSLLGTAILENERKQISKQILELEKGEKNERN